MSLRGRKPTPVSEKIVLGNPGKRALRTVVPKARDGRLVPPPEVSADPVALDYWGHYVETTAPGHLQPVDMPILAELCMTMSFLAGERAKLKTTGSVVKTPTGAWVQSPFLTNVNRARDAMIKLASNLALTVAERNRMGGHDVEDDDPTARFFDA